MSRPTRSSRQRVSSIGRRRRLQLESLERRQLLAADLLFADSFEVASEWSGKWVQDSQNDWFRSTQRKTDGSRSAEVDGSANNATLTLKNAIDLSDYSSAELTFSWFIESNWDTGEYIAIDVFNGSWQEVDRLRGNVDAENTWHHETVSLDNYLSAGFLLRFRASVSDSAEDGNVDNVRIVGTIATNQAPVAYAGVDQTLNDAGGNGDEFVMLSGTGSDSDGTIVSYEWRNGTTVLGTTAHLSTTLATGTHTLTLIVTDDDGASASDTIDITINEVLAKPVKVFLLAGQSNMTGTARVENLDPLWNVPQDDVWIWLDHNMDGGQWTTLAPGHGLSTHAPRPDEPEGLDSRNGLGPELSLGSILADAYPDHRVALIKHGDGGRDLASDFNPENIGPPESSDHMWNGLLKKTYDAFAVLDAAGYAYEVEGFFWAMGGGDARNKNSDSSDPNEVLAGEQEALARSAAYGENLTNFIHAVRDEFSDVSLPFVMSQIQDNLSPELLEIYPGAELVRQGQLDVAAAMPSTVLFTTEGITLRDAVHFDAMGQIEFGTRFVNNYLDLLSTSSPPQISISDATATEGDLSSYRFVDAFVTSQSGGLLNSQNSTIGPDGNLYVSSAGTNSVLKYDGTSGAFIQEFVSPGSGGLDDPRDLLFDTNGDLLVSSRYTNTVIRYDGQTGHFDSVLVSGGGLNVPHHMVYRELTNELFVSSAQSDEIYKYNGLTGELISTFVTSGSGGLSNPKGLALTETGGLLVVSQLGDQILEYNALGTFERIFYSVPAAEASTAILTDMVWGLDGNLLVTENNDFHGGRVIRLNADTGALMDVVVEPSGGGLDEVRGIAIDDDGNIYVASFDSHEILRYAPKSNAALTVNLSSSSEATVTVDFATSNNTAVAGSDYVATSGTLVFEPGVTARTIIVPTIDDTVYEGTEAFFVNLSNASGGEIVNSQGIGTILDDDPSQPPTANSDSYNTAEDTPLIVPASAVLANDTDPENALLTAVLVTTTSHGALTLNANGSFSYSQHDNFFGSDSFTYRANDGTSDSNLATVTISVNPVNDAPVAAADSYTVDQDSVLSIAAQGVLSNDSDVDGDTLTAIAWSGNSAQGGQVVLNSNGSFTYTPPPGFSGTDTFSYRASDGSLESNWATVSIAVEADNVNAMYVYDIRFESRYWGLQRRAVFEIRWDSNGDGQGGSADARRAGVSITVEFAGQTYSGTADANGLFRTSWIGNPGSGTYAEVVDMALVDFVWNPLALDLEDDTDGDGRPDAQL